MKLHNKLMDRYEMVIKSWRDMPFHVVYQKPMAKRCSMEPVLDKGRVCWKGNMDRDNINELIMVKTALGGYSNY